MQPNNKPNMIPETIPQTKAMGPEIMSSVTLSETGILKPKNRLYPIIDTTSSILAEAITIEGIAFLAPYPSF